MKKLERLETAALLLLIVILGGYLRFVGLDWGEGQAIHPDEEFLRQVTSAVQLPDSLSAYLDTAHSPLNPYNHGYGFFVYGTLPLFLTRAVGEALDAGLGPPPSPTARLLAPLLIGIPADQCWAGAFSSAGSRMIGRALAALFDLGGLVFVFLSGRRLWERWTGLLAALLYALSVLPIQQAHFYTVDATANFFVAATIYLAITAAQTGHWLAFALAGLTTGLGMACKISVWPLALVVALAGSVRVWAELRGRGDAEIPASPRHRVSPSPLPLIFFSGVIAAVAFRLAQPYAFTGPGFFGLHLNEQWLANMEEIQRLMSGQTDYFPGHQWANRPPLVFPWVNMVFWGLGLPLGLVAWAGWGALGVHLTRRWLRGREIAPALLPWLWATGYFLYQGAQWVKNMRYLLPVYPVFAIFAAWLVISLLQRPASNVQPPTSNLQPPTSKRIIGITLASVTIIGALFWALAYTSVYTHSHTRLAASRWIFQNVPTAATVHLRTADGGSQIQVTVPAGSLFSDGAPLVTRFESGVTAEATGVTLNYASDPQGDAGPERFRVALAADPAGEQVLAEAIVEATLPVERRGMALSFTFPPVRLTAGDACYLVTEASEGGPVLLSSSALGIEHWDWPPPLRVDGRDPFGGMYQGLSSSTDGTMQLYHEDTPEKREALLNWLDEADYIILGSNRLYASIPRLPTRYPLTIAYYRALFSGELGFELVADFTSYPALGPFQFPDTEEPFPVPPADYRYQTQPLIVPLLPAEEAFSVYDHPRTLIFRRTAAYSRARTEALLPAALLEEVTWITPWQYTHGVEPGTTEAPGYRQAILDPATWAEQRAGGTWAEMFDRQSPLNRSSELAATVWLLAVTLLGWCAFPLLFVALPWLRDRGYGLARAFGILVVGYLTWLAASLHLLPNSRLTISLAALLLLIAGGLVAWRRWAELVAFLRLRWKLIAVSEGLFLLLFAAWTWVRMLNPDLWHMVTGGEKPMDFAYLNAVIRSTWFPPYDPWFSGGYINYYYFGFVLAGSLARLTGIMPSVAYNLILSLFYALTGGAAFSVAATLVGGRTRSLRPYVAGLLAVLFVLVLGNLGEFRLLGRGFRTVAGEPTFESTIPGLPELVQTVRGIGLVLRGATIPMSQEAPYWEPTRLIPADESGVGPITEFPAFTFLYGDPHAHMLALPYTLFALALAVHWARGGQRVGALLIGGLVIGSLRAANTWDYPTYLALGLAGLALGWMTSARGRPDGGKPGGPLLRWRTVAFLWRAVLLVGLTALLFWPYIHHYISAYTRIHEWTLQRTALDVYLLLIGQFLFPLVTLLLSDARAVWRRWEQGVEEADRRWTTRLIALAGVGGVLLLGIGIALAGTPVAAVALPVACLAAVLSLWPDVPVERRFIWLTTALAVTLTLAVEVVVLAGDIGRMNTVFKFYLQVWTLLAVGAAVALVWLGERLRRWSLEAQQVWWIVMGMLVATMALFPLLGIPAKVEERFTQDTGPTLDGMAYMSYSAAGDIMGGFDLAPDYDGIIWLLENVQGSPVILEGLGAREYLWGSRISVYTGLPTVIGWRWHQVQQRMAGPPGQIEQRQADVNECYSTTDTARAWEILTRYEVQYIYVGPYERLYYSAEGLEKFDAMVSAGLLRRVYDQHEVRIYEVVQ